MLAVLGMGLAIFAISYLGSFAFRNFALAKQLLDIPNHRSSHTVPVPRGGGLVFVLCSVLGFTFLYGFYGLSSSLYWSVTICGSLIALMGFIDDCYSLSAKLRLLGQFLASGLALSILGVMDPSLSLSLSLIGEVFLVVGLVWLINLYNFMDGIDGLAAWEMITVAIGMAILYGFTQEIKIVYLLLVVIASVGGFLIWNFPKARIFMGDVGSNFLGMIIGILAIQAWYTRPALFFSWLILLGVFIVDASFTLLRRALSREPILEAHCDHIYQILSRKFGHKHLPITLAVIIINTLWLLPIAVWVGLGNLNEILGIIVAYTPLLIIAIHFSPRKNSVITSV